MQAMTSTICSETTQPDASVTTLDTTGAHSGDTGYVPSTTLEDTRDNETYTVRKLADGNCWMTQNLRLIGERTLTNSDSNVSSNFTLPASISSWTSTYTAAMVYDTGNTDYGVYYNYYAASARTISGSSNQTATSYSVCPKGWKLPTKNEYAALLSVYSVSNNSASSIKMRSRPLDFVYSGSHSDSGTDVNNQDANGNWWSATPAGNAGRYYTYIASSSAYAANDNGLLNRRYGYSIRCVAQ